MIVPRYLPGDWFAAVTDGTLVLLPPSAPAGLVDRMWTSLRRQRGFGDHLQELLRDGFAAVPPFALLCFTGGRVHAVVRGDVVVEVHADDGPRLVSGAEVTTWSEVVVPGARTVTVRTGTTSPASRAVPPVDGWGRSSEAALLPVLSAVVLAAEVHVALHGLPRGATGGEDTPATAPEDAPTPEPAAPPADAPVPVVLPAPHEPADAGPLLTGPAPVDLPAQSPHACLEPGAAHALRVAEHPRDAPGDVPDAEGSPDTEDHDGLTVLSSDVVALRRQLPTWTDDEVPALAVPAAAAPAPAKIHLSSGLVISLNRPVLLGRAPQVSRVPNSRMPRLVTVASPNQDISRTHAEVRQEGEHVLVTDLRSTNGVLLLRQGGGPQRLHPGEATVVEPGVVVDLGEGVTFTVEHVERAG